MEGDADIGIMGGSCLVFGGPYSNVHATRAVLNEAERLGIPRSRTVCTGDVVAYCANPRETVDCIREAGIHVIMGNCEESLGFDADDCGCGYEPGSACDLLAVQWYRYANEQLSEDAKAWMSRLPRRIKFQMGGKRFLAVHGGVNEINRFVFPSTCRDVKRAEIKEANVDAVIAGHSGVPFSELIDGGLWHNSGGIGMPANDGTPRVWYSVLVPEETGITVNHHVLTYDHRGASDSMRSRGLPEGYARTLVDGLWPSDDIMPSADRARRGQPIEPFSIVWD